MVAVVFLKDFMRTEYVAFAESPVAVQVRVVLLFAFKICVHLPPLYCSSIYPLSDVLLQHSTADFSFTEDA